MNNTMQNSNEKLVVLWTSGEREVALKMVFMYTLNSKLREWWKEVTLIVWGPSAKLLSDDEDLKIHIEKMIEIGVEVVACKACSDEYGVSEKLLALGIDVKYMGQPLTAYLKEDVKLITF